MKRVIINVLACVGLFLFMGAIGTSDYMVEVGEYYPLSETIKLLIIAFILEIPIIVREVF